jgi:hypothetical protein
MNMDDISHNNIDHDRQVKHDAEKLRKHMMKQGHAFDRQILKIINDPNISEEDQIHLLKRLKIEMVEWKKREIIKLFPEPSQERQELEKIANDFISNVDTQLSFLENTPNQDRPFGL